ncbi:MAG: response regulator transcription factor [Ferruginibacter sp.]
MIKILIADDHTVVRKGLRLLLEEEIIDVIVEEVPEAESLINKVLSQSWDVVISDINMPGRSGLDALEQIRSSHPKLPVLILSSHPEEHYAIRVLKAGASGYLNKNAASDELVKAVYRVMQGKTYFSPNIIERLATNFSMNLKKLSYEGLSNREFDVMKLLAGGKTVSQIAETLMLSVTTVSTYRTRIMSKTGLHSNQDLTKYAIENNLL